jgi:hypothetical protein
MSVKYQAQARDTGHPAFQENDFQGQQAKLLIDMTVYEKQTAHSKLKGRKFFGWHVGAMYTKVDVKYVADTIFSKANSTSAPFSFNYIMTESSEIETSIAVEGSIGSKLKGQIRAVEAALDMAIRGGIGRKKTTTRSEETKLNIIVAPNTKISMKVTGNAELSNGVGRYYFFGIQFKKGEWEYIDVIDECYELIEEKI